MYTVVRKQHLSDFETEVNRRLDKGWKLVGGISVTSNFFYQAMELHRLSGKFDTNSY